MEKLLVHIKSKINEINAEVFLNEDLFVLTKYFENLHKNSCILDMIKTKTKKKFKNVELMKIF